MPILRHVFKVIIFYYFSVTAELIFTRKYSFVVILKVRIHDFIIKMRFF